MGHGEAEAEGQGWWVESRPLKMLRCDAHTVSMTSLRNRVFADGQVKVRSLGGPQSSRTGVLKVEGNLDPETDVG